MIHVVNVVKLKWLTSWIVTSNQIKHFWLFDYKRILQVDNIACDGMPPSLPSPALYWCMLCQKAETFDHRLICGATPSCLNTLPPSCLNCKQTLGEHKWVELEMTWATTGAQHAVLDIATTHVSCKASTCFVARIVTMDEHLGSNWIDINPLATISYD